MAGGLSAAGKQFRGPACSGCICFRASSLHQRSTSSQKIYVGDWQRRQVKDTLRTFASSSAGLGDSRAQDVDGVASAVKTDVGRVLDTDLSAEVEKSYLSYAMSVIVGRALPDVRDGLKPVHRRILFAMHDLGLSPNKPFRKSARVVGEVLGKYHPHGDSAVYNALVRLAQPFSMRLPLINGHGNFGSQDDDPAAAMRYTECRLQQASSAALLSDLEFDTVKFSDTFDGAQQEPTVLPARVPLLLVNGSQGIAVGMATNIPPHNLQEVVDALEALVQDPHITISGLMTHIPGPDFPTGGEILVAEGVEEAYRTGRGSILTRGKAFIEGEEASTSGRGSSRKAGSGKPAVIITELPYQTNKAELVAHIAKLAEADVLQGITDVRDESDRSGMRVVVELKRTALPEVVLNNLYKHTQLQKNFPCNLVALVDKQPQTLSIKELLQHFLDFRCEVVTRRAQFELGRAERRAHIVGGLIAAQKQLDSVIQSIRKAPDSQSASQELQQRFQLSQEQAEAVLGMALRRLTSLEAEKLEQEDKDLSAKISNLKALLGSEKAIKDTVVREAKELADLVGNERRSKIMRDQNGKILQEDIIPNKQSLIFFSKRGYIKRMAADQFSTQGRGGKGTKLARLRDNDSVEEVEQVRNHQSILFFTTAGQVFSVKAYEIPEASRTAAGTALPQLLRISKDQKVTAMLPVKEFSEERYVMMLTKQGWMKRVPLSAFSAKRPGTMAITMGPGDELVWVEECRQGDDVLVATMDGRVTRCSVELYRPMGRPARGLLAVKQHKGSPVSSIVGIAIIPHQGDSEADVEDDEQGEEGEEVDPGDGPAVLFVSSKGYGKRMPAELLRCAKSKRTTGVIGMKLKQGDSLADFRVIAEEKEVLLSSSNGLLTRIALNSINWSGRNTIGVRVMRFKDESDRISSVTLLEDEDSSL